MIRKKKFLLSLFILAVIIFSSCGKKDKTHSQPKPIKTPIEKKEPEKIEIPKKIKQPKFTRGIYLNAYTVASKKFKPIIKKAKEAGINTVIFDLKNMNGDVFFKQNKKLKYLEKNHKKIINIKNKVKYLHSQNMRVASRIVMFHDQYLAKTYDELRPMKKSGGYWQESKRKKAWLDSSNPKVQKYLLNIIEIVAKSGVDEVQLDYIRFSTQGKQSEVQYYYQKKDREISQKDSTYIARKKEDIIVDFLKRVHKLCSKYDVTLTGDVFAITAWQRKADIKATGQNINRMTTHLDAINPMVYSSHFAKNFGFRKNVYNEPYYIVFKATDLTRQYSDSHCKVIPYIQSNSWKVNYIPDYIYAQIQAIKDAKGDGYLLWNASNKYDKTLDWLIAKKM